MSTWPSDVRGITKSDPATGGSFPAPPPPSRPARPGGAGGVAPTIEIGRGAGRGKGENSGGAGSLKKKKKYDGVDRLVYRSMKYKLYHILGVTVIGTYSCRVAVANTPQTPTFACLIPQHRANRRHVE